MNQQINIILAQATKFSEPSPIPEAAAMGRELVWASPHYLWFLLLLLPLLFLRRRHGAASCIKHPTMRFVQAKMRRPSRLAGLLGPLSFCLAMASLIVALAEPQWRREYNEESVSGIDIMIACDLSGSMEAVDMLFTTQDKNGRKRNQRVDRLTAAKAVINEFIEGRANDRLGLVAFAGKAKLCCPLTLDHGLLHHIINEFYLGYIDAPGTAIGSALASAAARLEEREETKSKIIILVTDGASNAGTISPTDAAKQAASLGIKIFTIAIGGAAERIGRHVAEEVDEKSLREIAHLTGGKYYRASSGQKLQRAFADIDKLEKTEAKKRTVITFESLFLYPLGLACTLLCLSFALSFIRPQPAP